MNKNEYDDIKANLIKKSLEKNKTDVYVPVERRKKIDGRLNFLNLMCIFCCGMVLIIIATITKAGKDIGYIFNNKLLFLDSTFWNIELLNIALIITIICIVLCTISIILNFTRNKRRTDKIKKPLIICEMISLLIFIFLILKLY